MQTSLQTKQFKGVLVQLEVYSMHQQMKRTLCLNLACPSKETWSPRVKVLFKIKSLGQDCDASLENGVREQIHPGNCSLKINRIWFSDFFPPPPPVEELSSPARLEAVSPSFSNQGLQTLPGRPANSSGVRLLNLTALSSSWFYLFALLSYKVMMDKSTQQNACVTLNSSRKKVCFCLASRAAERSDFIFSLFVPFTIKGGIHFALAV